MAFNFFRKKEAQPKKKKSVLREWLDALVFAVVVASVLRIFLLEPFTIPTGSMEGNLLIHDFLFVSKMHYGARVPMTPLAIPFVHNEIPVVGGKSYTDAVQWKYKRLPGFGKVERYDDVVFNYPEGDTIIQEAPGASYYDAKRTNPADVALATIKTRPVDKMDNYIKRCVGLPGDKLQIIDGKLYVNDQPSPTLRHMQSSYRVRIKAGKELNPKTLSDNFDINEDDVFPTDIAGEVSVITNKESAAAISKMEAVDTIYEDIIAANAQLDVHNECWPHSPYYNFNRDNFGPIVLPKKGDVVQLNMQTLPLYRRLIHNYEHHELSVKDSTIMIDGKPATNYTVEGNYYWMMGDNRHNSLDSRFWGYVPETHIVGKAWFVFFAYKSNGGPRWSRLFRGIKALEK